MKTLLVSLVSFPLLLFAIGSSVEKSGGVINELTYLGEAGGVGYYANQNGSWNWTEAVDYCKTADLHLAVITSAEQLNLLKSAYNLTHFSQRHWTWARDSHTVKQFQWGDLDFLDPADVTGLDWVVEEESPLRDQFLTCAAYNSAGNGSFMTIQPCSSRFYVLCET